MDKNVNIFFTTSNTNFAIIWIKYIPFLFLLNKFTVLVNIMGLFWRKCTDIRLSCHISSHFLSTMQARCSSDEKHILNLQK